MAVDMHSIAALVGSLQAAADMAKGLIGLRDAAAIQSKVIELQGEILSAQSSALAAQSDQFALLNRVRDLEEEVTKVEAWHTEQQKYELKEVGIGTFAYMIKSEMGGSEPKHLLCATCYQHRRKSILQFYRAGHRMYDYLRCPECKLVINVFKTNIHGGGPFTKHF